MMKKSKDDMTSQQILSTRDRETIEQIADNNEGNNKKNEEKSYHFFSDESASAKENLHSKEIIDNMQMKTIKNMNMGNIPTKSQRNVQEQQQQQLQEGQSQSQGQSQTHTPINTQIVLQSPVQTQAIQQQQQQMKEKVGEQAIQQQETLPQHYSQDQSPSKPKVLDINEKVKEELKKDKQNYYGKILKVVVFFTILSQYLIYVLFIEMYSITTKTLIMTLFRLIIFHIIFSLMIGALYATIRTNPGNIPLYWGFYIGDDEFKKKRYCLLCQVFKPDRTHHCSICNVCVLNMDHHCPWINNCIGFYNRKFFVQLLFYFFLTVLYLTIAYFPVIYNNCLLLYQNRHSRNYPLFLSATFLMFNYTFILGLTVMDFFFFKFHVKLVLKNCSTIESLDEDFLKKNKYDLGMAGNWSQVFGKNKLFWFIPLITEMAFPEGDGLNWPINQLAENITMKKEIKSIGENKSTSSNVSFLKQIAPSQTQSNYSTNGTNTHRTGNRDIGQIIELAHKE